ncbi:transmembrane inner ear expressed protein [Nematostella vectensis]|uniref:transmembrane inner ear expressed protein n=1 Tax=Nematostella vectensis TaxID=45351 RepID=UPI0013902165|nr:transmembrane inner ear expressed protein [Nematostella vectensis]
MPPKLTGEQSRAWALCLFVMLLWSSVLGVDDSAYLPVLKTKIVGPIDPTPTPLPATEQAMWGLRMWQVLGLLLTGTVVMVVICCCLCDCRVPKKKKFDQQPQLGYEDDSDESASPRKQSIISRDSSFSNAGHDRKHNKEFSVSDASNH